MDPRMLARLCGLLGGLSWVARWVLERHGAGDGLLGATYGAGLALLAIALAGAGAALAGAAWLRILVAVCFPVLGWSVLMVLHDSADGVRADEVRVDGVLGVLAVLVWVPLLHRARRRARLGSHAG